MKKYIVIGNPIDHSLSPKLHNYWIKINGIDAFYDKKEIREEELKLLIHEIKEKKIHGINVTVPFKKSVIPLAFWYFCVVGPRTTRTRALGPKSAPEP